jgi:hypothetical protein
MTEPGCPWHALAAYGPANIKWCEERLCAWVNEPANAWSNLAFVLVAAVIAGMERGRRTSGLRRAYAPIVAAIGATSFAYHASNVWLTQVLDFLGMYLLCCLLLGQNVVRLGWLAARALPRAYAAAVAALTLVSAAIVRIGAPIQAIVLALIALIVATEVLCRRRAVYRLGAFLAAAALLAAALACSLLDATRVWCDPADHVLQGHAAWHVLSALSLLAAYVHVRQFDRAG